MNCLLTGANGFLGKALMRELNLVCSVKSLSKSTGDYQVRLDTTIPMFYETFDIVVHAAGLAHIDRTKAVDNELFHNVNVLGTENLLKGLEITGIPNRLVFISSVAVYGQLEGNLINEYAELKAVDPYGESKIRAEQLLLDWCSKYNVLCTILRLPLVVGIGPKGNLGSLIKALKIGSYFNVGGGSAKKSMVLASDVALFILKASNVGGIYNLTDGYNPSFLELSCKISTLLGKGAPLNLPLWVAKLIAFVGDLVGNRAPFNSLKLTKITSSLTFDDTRARVAFNWNPTPVLQGIKLIAEN